MPWNYRKKVGPVRFSVGRRGVRTSVGCLVYILGATLLMGLAAVLLIVLL